MGDRLLSVDSINHFPNPTGIRIAVAYLCDNISILCADIRNRLQKWKDKLQHRIFVEGRMDSLGNDSFLPVYYDYPIMLGEVCLRFDIQIGIHHKNTERERVFGSISRRLTLLLYMIHINNFKRPIDDKILIIILSLLQLLNNTMKQELYYTRYINITVIGALMWFTW